MTTIPPTSARVPAADPGVDRTDARLAESAKQLEGMFVRQLFAAMRETVPQDGLTHGGAGEEMFTALLHEHVADDLPTQWDRGLASQVVRAMRESTPSAAGASRRETP